MARRRVRTVTRSGRAMRHAQRSGKKHRRGQFIGKWRLNWRGRKR